MSSDHSHTPTFQRWAAAAQRTALAAEQSAELAAPQFDLAMLLWGTTLLAVFFALLRVLGLLAVLLAFISFLGLLVWRASPRYAGAKRLAVYLMAGAILPISCLVYDPVLFQTPSSRTAAAVFIGFQILVFIAWQMVGPALGRTLSSVACGMLLVGTVIALAIGILLFPLAVVGLIVLLGCLGFVPLFTAWCYWKSATAAWRLAGNSRARLLCTALGIVLAMAIPLAVLASVGPLIEQHMPVTGVFGSFD